MERNAMGTISGIYEEKTIEPKTLLLGDNEFETGTLTVAAASSGGTINIQDGTVLTRDGTSGNFVPAANTSGALFVLTDHIITPITTAGNYAVRVCISGSVNRNLLNLGGVALTDAQADDLRKNNILALTVHEVQ